eukprot:TRINITY_DN3085_c2_g2_i1.p1 TRINITY_DN3085_c2_g2~~TRINITY_DN3085_c2_g2_i1.p1  ORF type:complete len:351 (+),score=154.32 TRINITY_DN3085_c2_g2_i1:54-1055(+)
MATLTSSSGSSGQIAVDLLITENATIEGLLKAKGEKGISWKYRYYILIGSTLFAYADQMDLVPNKIYQLKGLTISLEEKSKKCFINFTTNGREHVLLAKTPQLARRWHQILFEAASKDACEAPERDVNKKKTSFFSKQNLTEFAVTSSLGKKIVSEFVPPDTLDLFDHLKNFISLQYDKQSAIRFERNLLKIAANTALLYRSQTLTNDDFVLVRREVIRTWSIVIDCSEVSWARDVEALERSIKSLYESLVAILRPHLKPSHLNRLKEIYDCLSDHMFLDKFFSDENQNIRDPFSRILRRYWDKNVSEKERKECLKSQLETTGSYTDPNNFKL